MERKVGLSDEKCFTIYINILKHVQSSSSVEKCLTNFSRHNLSVLTKLSSLGNDKMLKIIVIVEATNA